MSGRNQVSCRHRLPGFFIRLPPWDLGNKKCPHSLSQGTRTEFIFCGTTLFAAEATTSCRCQHIRCPITLAMRQKILRTSPFPLPSTAHLPTRFSLRSQLCGTLCGCADDFTSVSTVSYLRYAYYNVFVSICQALFFTLDGQFKKPPRPLDLGGWGNYLFSISFRASLRLKLARPFSSKPMNFT